MSFIVDSQRRHRALNLSGCLKLRFGVKNLFARRAADLTFFSQWGMKEA
jgi:hypothetical protein